MKSDFLSGDDLLKRYRSWRRENPTTCSKEFRKKNGKKYKHPLGPTLENIVKFDNVMDYKINHVQGHSNIHGNVQADKLAGEAIDSDVSIFEPMSDNSFNELPKQCKAETQPGRSSNPSVSHQQLKGLSMDMSKKRKNDEAESRRYKRAKYYE